MTRLLLFNTDLEVGGTPTVVRELARRLPGYGFETLVASLKPAGPVAREIERDGGRVVSLEASKAWHLPRAVRGLRRLVRQDRIDVVLSFLMHANFVAAHAAGKRSEGDNGWTGSGSRDGGDGGGGDGGGGDGGDGGGGVRWWQSIQTTQPRPRWHWPLQKWAASRAEGFIVPSEAIREVARERCGIDPQRVRVIPNGVDEADVATAARVRGDGPLRVGFLGRLDPVKNVDVLIAGAGRVRDVELHIFGDGPERERLERLSAGSAPVHLHGVTDRHAALGRMDVLVLPSSAEGFGLVLVEAMSAGVPVIASDIAGIREVVEHERTGLLAPAGDAAALAGAIERLRDDAALAERLAGEGLRVVRERFTWDRIVPAYAECLRTGAARSG